MRFLVLLAPLALTGCSLLAPVTPPIVALSQELDEVLVCEGIGAEACEAEAVSAVWETFTQAETEGTPVRTLDSVTIHASGRYEVCWDDEAICIEFVPASEVIGSPSP
jgi:hypothetical protein